MSRFKVLLFCAWLDELHVCPFPLNSSVVIQPDFISGRDRGLLSNRQQKQKACGGVRFTNFNRSPFVSLGIISCSEAKNMWKASISS